MAARESRHAAPRPLAAQAGGQFDREGRNSNPLEPMKIRTPFQSVEGRARHSVRAATCNMNCERRAQSDAPYLARRVARSLSAAALLSLALSLRAENIEVKLATILPTGVPQDSTILKLA